MYEIYDPAKWVLHLRANASTRLRIFCFPFAGGGVAPFRRWPLDLPDNVDVCPVQLPGRENRLREQPIAILNRLVDTVADQLAPWLDLPFALFGLSMGGLIGFEVARELRRRGRREPIHLFVAACRAPQLPSQDAHLHALPDEAFLEVLRRMEGTAPAILENAELMRLVLPIMRADIALCETYRYVPEDPLPCPISAFGGANDIEIGYEALEGWGRQTRGRFRQTMLPGGHFFFMQESQRALLRVLSEALADHLDGN